MAVKELAAPMCGKRVLGRWIRQCKGRDVGAGLPCSGNSVRPVCLE